MEFLDTKIEEDGAYGTVDVQIAPIGDFQGSSADGKPIPEHLTQESLTKLADALNESNDEVLVDVDHKSTKSGNDKDTKAAGWLSRFIVDPIKGLFAKLKLTRHGRDLVDSREYRHLSPVFALNDKGEPIELHSVGMTNCPALDMKPILNSEPNTKEIIEMEITKEELVQLILNTINSAQNVVENSKPEVPAEEVKEEVKEEKSETCEETKEVENSCGKEDEKEVKNEEVKEVEEKSETTEASEATKEEVKEEIKEEVKNEEATVEEEKKEKEVIKLQALNSAPEVGIGDSVTSSCRWENKHGKAFFDELKKMGYRI